MATKELKFTIELDEENHPQSIRWQATDAPDEEEKACASMMVFLWDREARNSMSIDLWTGEMLVEHMKVHVYQNLLSMADSYQRATRDGKGAEIIRSAAQQFSGKPRPQSGH